MSDLLVFDIDGTAYGFKTSIVAGVVEPDRPSFIPGQKGFVNGIISLRGEPVAVIDLCAAFGAKQEQRASRKVVVIREKENLIGFDIGSAAVSFIWKEDLEKKGTFAGADKRVLMAVDLGGSTVNLIDWKAFLDEAAQAMSGNTEGADVEKGPYR